MPLLDNLNLYGIIHLGWFASGLGRDLKSDGVMWQRDAGGGVKSAVNARRNINQEPTF